MEQLSQKNEKLAQRLADILTRLNGGETLNPPELAHDYGVDIRTIRRDLQRLSSLCWSDEKGYRLMPSALGQLSFKDIRSFATLAGISGMYPSLGNDFIRELLDSRTNQVYDSKGHILEDASQFADLFQIFNKAIRNCQRVGFLYPSSTKKKLMPRVVDPYRLIHHHGNWYLAAQNRHEQKLKVFRLGRIKLPRVQHAAGSFKPDLTAIQQLQNEDSIWFGEQKQTIIVLVQPYIAQHFQQKKLLPEQCIEEVLPDGTLRISSRVIKDLQILPLIRYWLPHICIVEPVEMQQRLESELRDYLNEGVKNVKSSC